MKPALFAMLLLVGHTTITLASLSVTVDGDTTRIWDTGFRWSCSAQFFPVVRISNDTIYVTERDTMRLVTCLCSYDVCTRLTGLHPGSYTAVVTRRHDERIQDTVHTYEELAGALTFTISNPTALSSGQSLFQTPCQPESVNPSQLLPGSFQMLATYPNPFNPSTIIRFGIPKAGRATLDVYNMLGQHVATVLSERKDAGVYEVVFDSGNLSSGIYVCRLVSEGLVISTKMVLQR